ncbi:MAG: hypothetical protein ABI700_26280 [Chloroflexota bacterium]
MPEAKTSAQHEAVQQTVRDLLQGVDDPRRAAALVAAVVAHHAPELHEWAQAQLRSRHGFVPLRPTSPMAVAKPAATQFQALFGVRPVIVPQALKTASDGLTEASIATLQVDPELGRLCVALHLAAPLRIWVVIRQFVREHDGSGWIERKRLRELLKTYQIVCSDRHLRRILTNGEDIFWNVTRQRVYMRSWAHLAATLTETALAAHSGRIERNRPGVREMYVPVAGSLETWEAQLYAAWFAYRNNPTISRSELSALFNRDKTVLRRWEKTRLVGMLTLRHNYAQCPNAEAFFQHIPAYATSYVAWVRWQGRPRRIARIRWQLPNTYVAGAYKQHHRKGQASKVRKRVNRVTETKPADERRGGWPRLYFDQAETLRKFVRKHPEAEARYVWRGENRFRQGIFEINTSGFPLTHCLERAKPKDEQVFLKEAACDL